MMDAPAQSSLEPRGTTFAGCSMEFVSLGSAASVIALAWEAPERVPWRAMVTARGAGSGLTSLTSSSPVLLSRVTD